MEELVATGTATEADIAALLKDRHVDDFTSDRKTMVSSADTSFSRMWLNRKSAAPSN